MELSIFVAKVMAIIYIAAGFAALRGAINFTKVVDDFVKSKGLTFLAGFFTVLVGMLLIEYHNFWVKDWTVVITLVGWGAVIKGVMFIAFPELLKVFSGFYKYSKVWGGFVLIIGLLFGYAGFVM